MKYKDPVTGEWKQLSVKAADTLPIGTIVDYDGDTVPDGWEEVADYSTDEVDTGQKWIDGKSIYRKVFVLSTYESVKDIDISDLNVETFMLENMTISYSENGVEWKRPRFTWGTNTNEFAQVYFKNNMLRVRIGDSLIDILNSNGVIFRNTIIIIKYTKTTDQGGNV